jgi:hypothetical protein
MPKPTIDPDAVAAAFARRLERNKLLVQVRYHAQALTELTASFDELTSMVDNGAELLTSVKEHLTNAAHHCDIAEEVLGQVP